MVRANENILVNLEAETAQFMSEMTQAARHFDAKMGQMAREAKKARSSFDKLAAGARTMQVGLAAAAATLASFGAIRIVGGIIETNKSFAKLNSQLVTMEGSTEAAAAAFKRLEGFAKTTPFTLDQSVEAFVKLKALGLDPSEAALRSYGNTASALGKDMMQFIKDNKDKIHKPKDNVDLCRLLKISFPDNKGRIHNYADKGIQVYVYK